jgi:5-hydroxyisourate hydrolase-like protein (transthyretin family)
MNKILYQTVRHNHFDGAMSIVTIHILDLNFGRSTHEIMVLLEFSSPDGWLQIGQKSCVLGRMEELFTGEKLTGGIYRISANVAAYRNLIGRRSSYPYIPVVFEVTDNQQNYDISLMLSESGYTVNVGDTDVV